MDNSNKKSTEKTKKRLNWKSVLPIVLVSTVVSTGASAGIAYAFAKGFSYDVPTFVATFKNYDGTVIATVNNVQLGERVVVPEAAQHPTRPSHVEGEWIEWTFAGWDNDINAAMLKDMTFTAQYTGVHDKYTAVFYDGIDTTNPIGTYDGLNKGSEPSQEIQDEMASKCQKSSTETEQYTFSGWKRIGQQGDDIIKYEATYDDAHIGFNFQKTSDKKIRIIGFNYNVAATEDVVIPSTWGDLPVTEIAEDAFSPSSANSISLKSITIPSSVVRIGARAFRNCTNLTTVNFVGEGGTLNFIEERVFENTGLTQIKIPDSVTEIKNYAFANCENLATATFGKSVQNISSTCFEKCPKLEKVTVSVENKVYFTDDTNSVLLKETDVSGKYCIVKCVPTTQAVDFGQIAEYVSEIAGGAFEGCIGVKNIDMSACISLTKLGENCFKNCSELTEVIIGDNISTLPAYCFANCEKLAKLKIGKSLNWDESIDPTAFADDKALTTITVDDDHPNLKTINGILYDKDEHENPTTLLRCPPEKDISSINIPDTVTAIGAYAFTWNVTKNIVIPDQIKTIGEYAFDSCPNLESFSTGDGVTRIGSCALHDCASLLTFHLGKGLIYDATSMSPDFLKGCDKIFKFTVSDGHGNLDIMEDGILCNKDHTHIYRVPPAYVVENDTFVVPDGVLWVDAWAFKDVNIKHLTLNKDMAYLDTEALSTMYLKEIEIPADATKAPHFWEGGDDEFGQYWTSCFDGADVDNLLFIIRKPSLYAEVTAKTQRLYENLHNLNKSLNTDNSGTIKKKLNIEFGPESSGAIPDTITFQGCEYIKSVSFTDDVTSIGSFEFSQCISLTTVTLPKNVVELGQQAFSSNVNVTGKINIPGTLANVPNGLFANEAIQSLNIEEGVKIIEANAITGNRSLTELYLPSTITELRSNSFGNCSSLHEIHYNGTKTDWDNNVVVNPTAFESCSDLVVYGSDGNSWRLKY